MVVSGRPNLVLAQVQVQDKNFIGTKRTKNCPFSMYFGQNPLKIRHFSYKWAFFLIYFNIWHLFPTIWQIFPKIIIFALQQDKIFQKPPLSKIRIFWKNIHPCLLHVYTKVPNPLFARNCFSLLLFLPVDTYIVKPGHFVRRRVGRDGAFKVNVVTFLQVIEV